MFQENTDKAWEKYGKYDPYFGVCNLDKFHTIEFSEENRADFFKTGREYINLMFADIYQHFGPKFKPKSSLDFGCGVGRLLIPLAEKSEKAVGLDISDSMLSEALKNCQDNNISNVNLYKSDDNLSMIQGQSFDLIHSYIVFQHMSSVRGYKIFENMLNSLSPNGIGVLHFTYEKQQPSTQQFQYWIRKNIPLVNNFVNLLKKRNFDYPMMQMNLYDTNKLLKMLQLYNVKNVYCKFINHAGNLGTILYFSKQ